MESAGIAMFSATLNQSNGNSTTQNAFMDMNGDGYPDIVTQKSIQYTNTHGGFEGGGTLYRVNQLFDSVEMEMKTLNKAISVGLGGNYVHSFSTSISGGTSEASRENAQAAASISGNLNVNCDSVRYSYVDINGDGLPDMLSVRENQVTKARLNLGYHFTEEFTLQTSTPEIQSSVAKSISASLGGSFNIDAASFSGGFGIATTTTRDSTSFFDINGDGLPDKVTRTNNNKVDVQLNLGNRFQTVDWRGIGEISTNSSTTKSENVSFTINFYPFGGKLAITPGYNRSSGMSRPNYELRDIDGDGFLDVLKSDNESDLRVHCSTIARTNKLKTVTNSLGGKFTIDYKRSLPTYGLPGGKWVMSSVDVDYGFNDTTKYYIPHTKTAFEYSKGRHDRNERDFLGFAEVITKQLNTEDNDNLYRKIIECYDTETIYSSGNIISTCTVDSNDKKFAEEKNYYYFYGLTNEPSNINGGKYKYSTSFKKKNDRGVAYTPLKYTKNIQYDSIGNSAIMSEVYNRYFVREGDHGLLRSFKYSDKGSLDTTGNGDYDYETKISYHSKLSGSNYIFGLPNYVGVWGPNHTLYHEVKAQYNSTYSNQITRISKLLSAKKLALDPMNNPEGDGMSTNGYGNEGNPILPINPDSEDAFPFYYTNSKYAVTNYHYDNYGNIDSVYLPEGSDHQRVWYKYFYEDTLKTYLKGVEDVFGLHSHALDPDYRFGITNYYIDQNDAKYRTENDDLGRLISISSPNEDDDSVKSITFEYYPIATFDHNGIIKPAYTVTTYIYRQEIKVGIDDYPLKDYMKIVTFVDGFGRVIETRKESNIHNQ